MADAKPNERLVRMRLEQVVDARAELEILEGRLRKRIVAADTAGATHAAIGRSAKLTRSRISQIVREEATS